MTPRNSAYRRAKIKRAFLLFAAGVGLGALTVWFFRLVGRALDQSMLWLGQ